MTPRRLRRGALFLLLGLIAAFRAGAACFPAPSGVAGWWPGDGNANDIAGTNNGVLQGGATASAAGVVSSAFRFDGTNGYVPIPDSPVLRPTNLTIEAWMRFSSLDSAGTASAGQQYIVFKQNSRTSGFEGYNLAKMRTAGGDVLAFIVSSAAGQVLTLQSATLVATGLWYHVAGVRGSNFTQLYVNGQLERQTNVNFPQDYGNYPLLFGSSGQASWDRKLNGSLDEVSLYSRALSANEVPAIYAAGASGKCKTRTGPSITTQPQSLTVVAGNSATFTVAAAGATPLSYQWQFNGADVLGPTNTSFTLGGVQPANAGSYTVIVTNSPGSVTSAVAVLTVLVPPVITAQPESLTNVAGAITSFSATASGTAPLMYQWQLNGLNLTNGGRISGAITDTLSIANLQAADNGGYTLVVSNTGGAVTSRVASLTVLLPPGINTQPASQSVAAANTVGFSVTATGTPPLSYQWRENGSDLGDGGNISGATGAALTLLNGQTNDAGDYQVAVTNSVGSVTSTVARLTVLPPFQPASQSAGAVVLVNSQSARYLDFKHFIQPYLDNFGFPYTVLDITTDAPGQSISNCAVIIIGHSQLDTNLAYLSKAVQANLSLAVSNGTGLVNFDSDLSVGSTPRYQFVQDIFGFGYGSSASGSNVSLPPTEPSSQMHYITARHPTNDAIALRASMNLAGITLASNTTAVALSGSRPFVAVARYGQGCAVQWASYGWMTTTVLGPLDGLDDLVWRGVVWAARKPFVMRGLPNLVVLRMDDASGPFWWAQVANQIGFKPWIGIFLNSIDSTEAADLSSLVNSGKATTSVHSFDCCSSFFYFNHSTEAAYSDSVMSNNYAVATQWHASYNIPISKVVCTHYSEMGLNAFAGLKAWGVEFFPIEVVPGTVEYASPGAPWLVGAPYRLYETPQPGQVNWPLWYADFLSVPGHPEFDGQFFNCYVEVRDDSSCHEWCPANNDVAGSIGHGTRQVKRGLDSMALGQLYTHEWYLIPIPQSSNQTPISSNNWSAILQGITNNLGAYAPNYVTMDYAYQYVRATRTSRPLTSAYDPASGQVTVSLSGYADLDTSVYVFVGADNSISSSFGTVPAFSGSVSDTVATLTARPMSPVVINGPRSLTNGLGSSATFTVTAAGTAPLGYRWMQNLTPLVDGGNISGVTSPSLTLTAVTSTNAGSYAVVITNLASSVLSPAATLTVVAPPQFSSLSLSPGQNPLLSFNAVSNLTYRIDASSDLVSWTTLTNIPDPNGTLQFMDPSAANFPQRFYRVVWVP